MFKKDIFAKFIIKEEEKEYLSSRDESFKMLIEKNGDIDNYYIPNHFIELVNSVIYQAVSFKAATTI